MLAIAVAKASNMVIVPDRPNDLAGVVATAMGMYSNVKAQTQGARSVDGSNLGSAPTPSKGGKPADWTAQ